jgi:hypothetical protein
MITLFDHDCEVVVRDKVLRRKIKKRIDQLASVSPIFEERWADHWVLIYAHIIDNSDLGMSSTYKVDIAVYDDEECLAGNLVAGFSRSGRWHTTPETAINEAALNLLHDDELNRAYRAREDSWRRAI